MFSIALLTVAIALVGASPITDEAGPQNLVNLTQSVNTFGLNLLAHLEKSQSRDDEPKNLLISPLSISSVLTTLLGGSAQQTNQQLYRALGYEAHHLLEPVIQENYAKLRQALNEQMKKTENILEIADAVAIQKGYPILESFQQTLKGEEMMVENFQGEAHKSTEQMNHWVATKTHNKIPKLFDQDIDPETVMVLLNAVYFKGLFKQPFKPKLTTKAPFTYNGRNGRRETEQVEMMYAHSMYKHARFVDGDLLEIPFMNDSTSFIAFLPAAAAEHQMTELSSTFATTNFAERLAHLRPHEVHIHLPKFKIESSYTLNSALKALGIEDAFERGVADFSRINCQRDLVVSTVAHKAFIEVNEEGSEAAAATGVIMVPTSVQLPIHFNANRPFFFMIYDKEYQVALFAGVVNKP